MIKMDVVKEFKERTDLYFNGNRLEVEDDVRSYIQSIIDDYELDVQIIDIALYGSRSRGIERTDSDMDIVFEYTGTMKEDALFDILHEEEYHIKGNIIDINPIKADKSGTLAEYLERAEEYLKEKGKLCSEKNFTMKHKKRR